MKYCFGIKRKLEICSRWVRFSRTLLRNRLKARPYHQTIDFRALEQFLVRTVGNTFAQRRAQGDRDDSSDVEYGEYERIRTGLTPGRVAET